MGAWQGFVHELCVAECATTIDGGTTVHTREAVRSAPNTEAAVLTVGYGGISTVGEWSSFVGASAVVIALLYDAVGMCVTRGSSRSRIQKHQPPKAAAPTLVARVLCGQRSHLSESLKRSQQVSDHSALDLCVRLLCASQQRATDAHALRMPCPPPLRLRPG